MVLPKYFLLTARKILILPKSSKLGGAIAPPAPPAGTAMGAAYFELQRNDRWRRQDQCNVSFNMRKQFAGAFRFLDPPRFCFSLISNHDETSWLM